MSTLDRAYLLPEKVSELASCAQAVRMLNERLGEPNKALDGLESYYEWTPHLNPQPQHAVGADSEQRRVCGTHFVLITSAAPQPLHLCHMTRTNC